MKRFYILLSVLALATHLWAAGTDYSRRLTAGVTYTGRTATDTASGAVSYDWTGTYLETLFTGTAVAIEMSDTKTSYHNVYIDGQWRQKIKVEGSEPQRVALAEGLAKGQHRLCVQRCSEGSGRTTVHGLYLARGGTLTATQRRERMIEVYGDSYTCGYGADSPTSTEHFKLETENVDHAYAVIIARYFGADYATIAHSGQGMVRNYGDKQQRSKKTLFTRHTQVYDEHDTTAYHFDQYRPDLVMICLGTNDFSTTVTPTVDQFVGNYMKMIQSLRSHYGRVPILCILPFSARKYLQVCQEELRRRCYADTDVHFSETMLEVMRRGKDFGADGHPNYQGHQKIAMKLIPQISQIMDWDMEDKTIK